MDIIWWRNDYRRRVLFSVTKTADNEKNLKHQAKFNWTTDLNFTAKISFFQK